MNSCENREVRQFRERQHPVLMVIVNDIEIAGALHHLGQHFEIVDVRVRNRVVSQAKGFINNGNRANARSRVSGGKQSHVDSRGAQVSGKLINHALSTAVESWWNTFK